MDRMEVIGVFACRVLDSCSVTTIVGLKIVRAPYTQLRGPYIFLVYRLSQIYTVQMIIQCVKDNYFLTLG